MKTKNPIISPGLEERLCEAIKKRAVISFTYRGYHRVVEPYLVGIHKRTGLMTLSAWWLEGMSLSGQYPHWRDYKLHLIMDLKETGEKARSDRPRYNDNDSRMHSIICRV